MGSWSSCTLLSDTWCGALSGVSQVWVPNLALADGPEEDKLVAVAATKLLTEAPDVYQNRPLWDQLRGALDAKLKGASGGQLDRLCSAMHM
jgi:hypothetical protein